MMSEGYEMMSLWIARDEKQIIRAIAKKNRMSMSDVFRLIIGESIKNLKGDSTLRLM